MEDTRRFGQTFLIDTVKTEQINDDRNKYIRPTIQVNDVLVVADTNSSVILSEHMYRKLVVCNFLSSLKYNYTGS